MKKTASNIADTVLQKFAATFYRGMGEPFLKEVLEKGLQKGHSVSTAKDVAQEYVDKAGISIIQGDLGRSEVPPYTVKARKLLTDIGLTPHQAGYYATQRVSPKGSLIQIDIPDSTVEKYLGGFGLPHLGERITTNVIPQSNIKVLSSGSPVDWRRYSGFPSTARRLTPRQLRLLKRINQEGKGSLAKEIIENIPQSSTLDLNERLAITRANRKDVTKRLLELLA